LGDRRDARSAVGFATVDDDHQARNTLDAILRSHLRLSIDVDLFDLMTATFELGNYGRHLSAGAAVVRIEIEQLGLRAHRGQGDYD
jgi:hypothetical protein